jgi:hypothetical protein
MRLPGWKGPLQFFYFICKNHPEIGIQESYQTGYNSLLICGKELKNG